MTEVLLAGRGLLESPRWHDGRLYFSDWSAGEVLAIDLAGRVEVVVRVASLPLCTAFLPDGRLLIVDSAKGQVLDGSLATYAELGPPGGWNDIAIDHRGNAYVNGVDLTGGPGAVHLVTPAGEVRQVAGDLAFPNGMAVTASTLIVAESYGHRLTAFDIDADGGLSRRRVWADLGDGVPDGISVSADGAIWYADVPNQRCVLVAEGGAVQRTVELDRGAFACALNDTTLFVAAAQWRGMTEQDMVTPGSGQVLAVPL